MSETLYFAYGSNLDCDQMQERCPGSRALFRATLRDHRLDFTHFSQRWSGGAADVVSHHGAIVWGVVYELPAEEWALLDRFEGGYERLHLDVHDDEAALHRTVSYTVRRKQSFTPTEEYLNKMLHWSERWGFPGEYLELLRCARLRA